MYLQVYKCIWKQVILSNYNKYFIVFKEVSSAAVKYLNIELPKTAYHMLINFLFYLNSLAS